MRRPAHSASLSSLLHAHDEGKYLASRRHVAPKTDEEQKLGQVFLGSSWLRFLIASKTLCQALEKARIKRVSVIEALAEIGWLVKHEAREEHGVRSACRPSLQCKVEHLEGLYTVAQTLVHNPQTLTQKQSRQSGIKRIRGAGATGTTEVPSLLGFGGSGAPVLAWGSRAAEDHVTRPTRWLRLIEHWVAVTHSTPQYTTHHRQWTLQHPAGGAAELSSSLRQRSAGMSVLVLQGAACSWPEKNQSSSGGQALKILEAERSVLRAHWLRPCTAQGPPKGP